MNFVRLFGSLALGMSFASVLLNGCGTASDATLPAPSSAADGSSLGKNPTPARDASGSDPSDASTSSANDAAADATGVDAQAAGCSPACNPTTESCLGGVCRQKCGFAGVICPSSLGPLCADPLVDSDNCGVCGNACPSGQACVAGKCSTTCANPTHAICNRTCTDLNTDPAHCGACKNACPSVTNAWPSCNAGTCGYACKNDYANCDGAPGCETDTRSNAAHCGVCGNACSASERCYQSACVTPKRVFVTSTTYTGNLGGTAGADAICAARAAAASLSGVYRAWVSAYQSTAADRFSQSPLPHVRTDGVLVAEGLPTLLSSGSLLAPIDHDEFGAAVSPSAVWTGTQPGGKQPTATWDCEDWTSSSSVGEYGLTTAKNAAWTWTGTYQPSYMCNLSRRLYCFEQ